MSCSIVPRRLAALLVPFCILVVVPGRSAPAQMVPDALPPPISESDLARYADLLALSPAQQRSLHTSYEGYIADFHRVEDNQIVPFLDRTASVRSMKIAAAPRDVSSYLAAVDALLTRIRTLDDGFFDALQAILDESQISWLPALKAQRSSHRHRALVDSMKLLWLPRTDLVTSLADLDLPPGQCRATVPILQEYALAHAAAWRDIWTSAAASYRDMVEAAAAQGYTPDARPMLEARWRIVDDHLEPLIQRAVRLRRLNLQTWRQLCAVLPASVIPVLRAHFCRRDYRDALVIDRYFIADECCAGALRLDRLSQDQREAIKALAMDAALTLHAWYDRVIKFVDNNYSVRGRRFFGSRYSEACRKYREEIAALRDEVRATDARMLSALREILGDDLVALHWDQLVSDARGKKAARLQPTKQTLAKRAQEPVRDTLPIHTEMPPPNWGLTPPAITPEDLQFYAWIFGMDESWEEDIDQIYDQYSTLLRERVIPLIQAVLDKSEQLAEVAEDQAEEWLQWPAKLSAMREGTHEECQATDVWLLESLATLAGIDSDSSLWRLACLSRDRRAYWCELSRRGDLSTQEATVDLLRLMHAQGSSLDASSETLEVLLAYEATAVAVVQEKCRVRRTERRVVEEFDIERKQLASQGVTEPDWKALEQAMNPLRDRLRELDQRLGDVNRAALANLRDTLSERESHRLLTAFRRAAYRTIYASAVPINETFDSAFSLPDLTDSQRADLSELAADFRSERQALSSEMLRIVLESGAQSDGDQQEEAKKRFGRLRSRLSELESRVLAEIRLILTDEQTRQIDALSSDSSAGE
jgi:hypothetical protein